ncbi:MAG: energy-coupling factor ABC transporter ATP-binding protein [Anaerolineales bacterium]
MNISVKNLSFTFPSGIKALNGISLDVRAGEKVAIVGQNGAGKTTLVRHLNGLLQPTQGTVTIGDWDTHDTSIAQMAARVGYVFQNPDDQLFSRSVLAELEFGPNNLKFVPEKVKEVVQDAVSLADLTGKEAINPYDLSPAWRKMVAMGAIISMDTPILILDEPTTGQDARNVARIAHIVQTLHQRGKTIIAVTHDIDFCAENFDRIIVMKNGHILLDGPTHEVIVRTDTLAETFVDPPQLTRLAQRLGLETGVRNPAELLDLLQASIK